MNILMIFGHPDMTQSRVSKKWLELARKENSITTHVLSQAHKNWEFDVVSEQKNLEKADRIVIIYPIQWYASPAILKKWLDDVWTAGWAYGNNGDKLVGKELIINTHCAGPKMAYRVGASNMNSVDDYLRPWAATANYCKLLYHPGYTLFDVYSNDDDAIAKAGKEMLSFMIEPNYRSPSL